MFPLLEESGVCPVCASPDLRPLHVYAVKKRRIGPGPELALLGCEGCGVAFSHPLPSEQELEDYYASTYWDDRLPRVTPGQEEKLERHRRQLELLRPHLELPTEAAPRAFDYGCGRGEWLDVLAAAGFDTYGLEPGRAARSIAGERHTMVEALNEEDAYDLVVLNHVLEHLRDPLAVLRRVVAATRPGGYVFVSVPDLGRLHEHRRFTYVVNGWHLMSFTSTAMASLMALAGLEVAGHFDTPEWDAVLAPESGRLKMLGRRTGEVAALSTRPLEPAVESLRAYGHVDDEAREEERAARPPRGAGRRLLGRLAGR